MKKEFLKMLESKYKLREHKRHLFIVLILRVVQKCIDYHWHWQVLKNNEKPLASGESIVLTQYNIEKYIHLLSVSPVTTL